MDNNKLFAASLRHDLSTLDLHGLYPAQALEKLELFLYNVFQGKETIARIICGIGTGALQEAVVQQLRKHPLVQDVTEEVGSVIIFFHTK